MRLLGDPLHNGDGVNLGEPLLGTSDAELCSALTSSLRRPGRIDWVSVDR